MKVICASEGWAKCVGWMATRVVVSRSPPCMSAMEFGGRGPTTRSLGDEN